MKEKKSPAQPAPIQFNKPVLILPQSKHLLMAGTTALVLAVVASGYFFMKYQKSQALLNNPTKAAQEQTKELSQAVGQLIELPPKETPTVATVSDITKLKDQIFFNKAKNGDKVLIYQTAKKAILYRPSSNKIIEVAPINVGDTNQGTVAGVQTTPAPTKAPLRVVVYNGTSTAGQAKVMQNELKAKFPNDVQVIDTANAAKNDYQNTLVIDLKGNQTGPVSQIAQTIGGQSSTLPEGEKKPDADILVIVGGK